MKSNPQRASEPQFTSPFSQQFFDRRRSAVAVSGLILLHALLLAYLATVNSVTYDEHAHLPAGVAYLKYGDYSIYNKSPPLLRWWAAAPVLLAGANVPPISAALEQPRLEPQGSYGDAFMRANLTHYQSLFVLARRAFIPLSCLTAWLIYRWARRLFGRAAGLAASVLYVICPNVLAHASLITTDIGSGTFLLLALWTWQRYCRKPVWGRLGIAALALAAAHLCKFTAFLLWPVVVAGVALHFAAARDGKTWKRLGGLVIAALATLLLINAAYGFSGSGAKLQDYVFKSSFMHGIQAWGGSLPMPLPREFVRGFDAQKVEAEGSFLGYLFEEFYRGGRWYYYPVALACKLPVSLLLLAALTLWKCTASMTKRRFNSEVAFVLTAMLVFVVGLVGLAQLNIGVRYLLPIFPLAFVSLGFAWREKTGNGRAAVSNSRRDWKAWIATALLLGMFFESTLQFPRYLSFFNFAAGGPAKGWKILGSSNFDWGQGLVGLADWMRARGVPRVHLANFGPVDPAAYGISYTPLDRPGNEPFIAVSGHFLSGGRARIYTPAGQSPEFFQIPFFKQLQARPPVARVGGCIFVFKNEDVIAAQREFAATQGRLGQPGARIGP